MTGLLGALGLDLDGTGEVLPHEQTMPKDRLDRLSLLRSTRLNTSPIWALSLGKGLTAACREAIEHAAGPPFSATDAAQASPMSSGPLTDDAASAQHRGAQRRGARAARRRPPPL